MIDPAAAHMKMVSAPRLPVAILLELHRLCKSVLSSPEVTIHEGDCNETAADAATGIIRPDRPGEQLAARESASERDCSARSTDAPGDRINRQGTRR